MYKINSTKVDGTMFWSNVTYTLTDGTEITRDVSIDSPQSVDDVNTEIASREQGEQDAYDSLKAIVDNNNAIKIEIDETIGV
jgi:hypothetical protein